MVSELWGPFVFGLSAFALIIAAANLLPISRLVASEHTPLGVAIEYFIWQLPAIVVLVAPAGMLLGVLLTLQRLSGESEITALKAGGISLMRIVRPFLVFGFVVSIVALILQEALVPIANDRSRFLREDVIKHVATFGGGSSVAISLPGGGRQFTTWTRYDSSTQTLFNITLIQYDRNDRPQLVAFSAQAKYDGNVWQFERVREYHFSTEGDIYSSSAPTQTAGYDIGEEPTQIARRLANDSPENMSRAQIKEVLAANILSPRETRMYQSTYEVKLARPFASFVFALLAVPFGLRSTRGGGSTGLGFGLAVLIVFVYFVIQSIFSAIAEVMPGGRAVSIAGAWLPNLIFSGIGYVLLRRAAGY